MVGDLMCPLVLPRGAMPCCRCVSAVFATRATCVEPFVDNQFDFALWRPGSPSPIKRAAIDPMLIEASLCTPQKVVSDSGARPLSIDFDPRAGRVSRTRHLGMVGSTLEAEFELMTG